MDSLILKKAIFYPKEIVIIERKENIIIPIADIETIFYYKPTISTYLIAIFIPGGNKAKHFDIQLKTKTSVKKESYRLLINYKDVLKIKEFFQFEISICLA